MGIMSDIASAKKPASTRQVLPGRRRYGDAKLTVTKTETFDNSKDALAKAKKMFAAGELSKNEFDKIVAKLGRA